jgi:hypothetical protein
MPWHERPERACYYRAVAMEVDGEMDVLAAGAGRTFTEGPHPYSVGPVRDEPSAWTFVVTRTGNLLSSGIGEAGPGRERVGRRRAVNLAKPPFGQRRVRGDQIRLPKERGPLVGDTSPASCWKSASCISILVVLFGLSFSAFYRTLDNATRLRRARPHRAFLRPVKFSRHRRAGVNRAVDGAVEQHCTYAVSGETAYFSPDQRAEADSANARGQALAGVKSSRIIRDIRGPIAAWRWELELNAGKKEAGCSPAVHLSRGGAGQEKP